MEVGVVGMFLGVRTMWCGREGLREDGDRSGGKEERLAGGAGEGDGCSESDGGIGGGEDAVHEQITPREKKGNVRGDVRVVAESKPAIDL